MFRRVSSEVIDGVRYEVWRSDDESDGVRIPNDWLESVAFLYATEEDARASVSSGGTGFAVRVPAQTVAGSFKYIVTNRHVAETCPVVRFVNPSDGRVTVVVFSEDQWAFHPAGDDLAVAGIPAQVVVRTIPMANFISKALLEELDLGPGDDTVIVGRFVGLDHRIQNSPTVRFGHLAMATVERVKSEFSGLQQESLIVEMRTLTGYSGSPVFLTITPTIEGPYTTIVKARQEQGQPIRRPGTWLIGIEWGNFNRYQHVRERVGEGPDTTYPLISEPWYVRENSGMSLVVPAWKIEEVLMDERLADDRRQQEEKVRDQQEVPSGAAPTVEHEGEPFTKDNFEAALKKVSRRKPSPPDEETSGT